MSASLAHSVPASELEEYCARAKPPGVIQARIGLPAALEPERVQTAINEVVAATGCLRAVYQEREGRLGRRVLPGMWLTLAVENVALGDSNADLRALASRDARAPFDLERGPLARWRLLQGDSGAQLLATFHRAAVDLDAARAIAESLVARLARPGEHGPRRVASRCELDAVVRETEVEAWRGSLPRLELIAPEASTGAPPGIQARVEREVPIELRHSLEAEAARLGCHAIDLVQWAISAAVAAASGGPGLVIAIRDYRDPEPRWQLRRDELRAHWSLPEFFEACSAGAPAGFDLARSVEMLRSDGVRAADVLAMSIEILGDSRSVAMHEAAVELRETLVENSLAWVLRQDDTNLTVALTAPDRRRGAALLTELMGLVFRTLSCGLTRPDQPIRHLALTEAETRREFDALVAGPRVAAASKNVCSHFERIADSVRGAIAVHCAGEQVSYSQLNWRANQLARSLARRGIGAESRVGVCLPPSIEAVTAILGILKTGGAYVPLDPEAPRERLRRMLEIANVQAVVVRDSTAGAVDSSVVPLLRIDRDWPSIARERGDDLKTSVATGQLAYVLFTSGSTGLPKGVEVSHDQLAHSNHARHHFYGSSPSSFLLLSSLFFDSSLAGLFWTLTSGGRIVIPQRDELMNPSRLARLVASESITHLLCIPSLYDLLIRTKSGSLSTLEVSIVAGEVCPPDLVERHRAATSARLVNEYGPTEASVWCSVADLSDARDLARVPIGRPIANTRIYLLDDALRPVPAGHVGEIFVAGDGVARGYAAHPSETADRFGPDPFCSNAGARMYRTGDLGRFRLDGELEFIGRSDHQVKLNGQRLELEEVERALMALEGVRCAAAGIEHRAEGDRLVAYVELTAESSIAGAPFTERARTALSARLPKLMVPSALIQLDRLPTQPNGKLDRRALFSAVKAPTHTPARQTDGGVPSTRSAASDLVDRLGNAELDLLLSELLRATDRSPSDASTHGSAAATRDTLTLELNDAERAAVNDLLSELCSVHEGPGSRGFDEEMRLWAYRLPDRLVRFMERFRIAEPAAIAVLRGCQVSSERIGPTPHHWRDCGPQTRREDFYLVLLGSLLGDVFGWSSLQHGGLVHNVLPIRGDENEQNSHSSSTTLAWHTEDGFHDYRCDYLGLLCLRDEDRVGTTVCSTRALSLSTRARRHLARRAFVLEPDTEHLRVAQNPYGQTLEAAWREPAPRAVLTGHPDDPYMCLDPWFMHVVAGDADAAAALRELVGEIDANLECLVLAPGDAVFVDNCLAVHGRRAFQARYDGADRWLKKIVVTRDLRKSRAARDSATSRIVHALPTEILTERVGDS